MQTRFYTLALVYLFFGATLYGQMLRDEIILNMPFSGDVTDYSGNALDGNIIDATLSTDRFSTLGDAYHFDGIDDNIEIPHSPDLKPELPITISMWVNPEDVTSTNNQLFTNDDHSNFYSGIMLQLHPNYSGAVAISYGSGNGSGPSARRTAFGQTPLVPNTWSHIVAVIRGPVDMDIYVNGVQDSIVYDGNGGNIFYTESPGRIGAYDGSATGGTRYFKGTIDDVKMWSEALSEDEVQSIYNELIWDMPINSDALDYSGNMIDGIPNVTPFVPDRFEEAGSAVAFDGFTSNIEIPHNPLFKPQIPFSVSYWVNLNDINHPGNVIFANDDHPDFYSGITMRINHQGTGQVSLTYGTGGGSGPGNRRTAVSVNAIEATKWFHIVGVCRGPEDMDIYINGVKEDSLIYSGHGGDLLYTEQSGRVGAYDGNSNGSTQYFSGKLDEFKMWNRAITQNEVDVLYTPGTVSSVKDFEGKVDEDFRVFPNPTSDFLQVNLEKFKVIPDYQIFTMQGHLVKEGKLEREINIKSLQSGGYILKLYADERSLVKYFLKR